MLDFCHNYLCTKTSLRKRLYYSQIASSVNIFATSSDFLPVWLAILLLSCGLYYESFNRSLVFLLLVLLTISASP